MGSTTTWRALRALGLALAAPLTYSGVPRFASAPRHRSSPGTSRRLVQKAQRWLAVQIVVSMLLTIGSPGFAATPAAAAPPPAVESSAAFEAVPPGADADSSVNAVAAAPVAQASLTVPAGFTVS